MIGLLFKLLLFKSLLFCGFTVSDIITLLSNYDSYTKSKADAVSYKHWLHNFIRYSFCLAAPGSFYICPFQSEFNSKGIRNKILRITSK